MYILSVQTKCLLRLHSPNGLKEWNRNSNSNLLHWFSNLIQRECWKWFNLELIVLSFPQNSSKFVFPSSMVINLWECREGPIFCTVVSIFSVKGCHRLFSSHVWPVYGTKLAVCVQDRLNSLNFPLTWSLLIIVSYCFIYFHPCFTMHNI